MTKPLVFAAVIMLAAECFATEAPAPPITRPGLVGVWEGIAGQTQLYRMELSSGGDDVAVCARAIIGNENSASTAKIAAANPSCERLGIISPALDMSGAEHPSPPGNGLRAKSKTERRR